MESERPGKAVTRILKERGTTQRELAERLKITPGGVHHILCSERWHVDTLLKLAKALEVPVSAIDGRFK